MPRDSTPSAVERLTFFVERGHLERVPSRWQLLAGWIAALPVYLGETERERAVSRSTWLGQVPIRAPLQALFSPSHLRLQSGLSLPASAIVRHLLCVYHEDAFLGYDLQLLQSHPRGLDELECEARRVARGVGARSRFLQSLVGSDRYHESLVEHARRARAFVYPDALDIDPRFATLVGFAKFCNTLPAWPAKGFYGFEEGGRWR